MSAHIPLSPVDPTGAVLGDEVYAILGDAISDGRLTPGQRLRDVELAEALGVSRTPVREALQRLERIGLVEVSANRYTRVSVPDAKLLADTHEYIVYAMGCGLRMALERCPDASLDEAVHLADLMIEASADDRTEELMLASGAFYRHIAIASENIVFLTIMREAGPAFQRNMRAWRPPIADPETRTLTYVTLRDAVIARDGALAETVIRAQHDIG